jgi:4-hydroxy-3-methylbut-2-enyl diphosphate reductase
MSFNIHLAKHRGYCSWVSRAIKILEESIEKYEQIYVNHEIIHNKFIINYFIKKGVVFEEDIDKIPSWANLVISAHGTDPNYITRVRDKGINIIDATCPLVTKVHLEAKDFLKRGYKIIYIWKKWHQEAEGVMWNNRENVFIVSDKQNVDDLVKNSSFFHDIQWKEEGKVAVLTQTTLSVIETKELIEYISTLYPSLEVPKTTDICYATTDRQNSIKELALKSDIIFVVWSKSSSNSNKLRDLSENLWTPAYLIDSYTEIDSSVLKWSKNIGISAWASAPEHLVQEVVEYLEERG